MDAQQRPGYFGLWFALFHDHAGAASAAMGSSISEEITHSLESKAKGRGVDSMSRHWKMVERIVESQWVSDD